MSLDPVETLIVYHAAIEAQDIELVETMLAEHATYEFVGLGTVAGRDAIVMAMREYFIVHPDHHAWDVEVKATGPRSAFAAWQLEATNSQTGQHHLRKGLESVVFDDDGLIVEIRVTDTE